MPKGANGAIIFSTTLMEIAPKRFYIGTGGLKHLPIDFHGRRETKITGGNAFFTNNTTTISVNIDLNVTTNVLDDGYTETNGRRDHYEVNRADKFFFDNTGPTITITTTWISEWARQCDVTYGTVKLVILPFKIDTAATRGTPNPDPLRTAPTKAQLQEDDRQELIGIQQSLIQEELMRLYRLGQPASASPYLSDLNDIFKQSGTANDVNKALAQLGRSIHTPEIRHFRFEVP
jgi:hypothetical protein